MSKMKIQALWLWVKAKKQVEYSQAILVKELIIEGWDNLFFLWPYTFHRRRMNSRLFPKLAMAKNLLDHSRSSIKAMIFM